MKSEKMRSETGVTKTWVPYLLGRLWRRKIEEKLFSLLFKIIHDNMAQHAKILTSKLF